MSEDGSDRCPTCGNTSEIWEKANELKRLMDMYDHLIEDATEAGLDRGRIMGLLEAADALERAGYPDLADVIRLHSDIDTTIFKKPLGEA